MAMLTEKNGLIRDRSRGYKELCYYVPKESKTYMKACKQAHETIVSLLTKDRRDTLTGKDMRRIVMQFVELDGRGRQSMLSELLYPVEQNYCSLTKLFDLWQEGKVANCLNEKQVKGVMNCQKVLFDFFNANHLETTEDFQPDTANKFIAWRTNTTYGKNKGVTSASTIKKELDSLKQLARLAAVNGWIKNGNIWDNSKIKSIAGMNKKIVEPLSIEEQKSLLSILKQKNEAYHDIALFLLVTGIRVGELKTIKPDSIRNGIITLHGEHVGNYKTTGKTSSASRNIPVCPTVEKLFEREHIFKTSTNALRLFLSKNFKGVHAHRFRHTFAVNKLLAQAPLQMVSYQMGHAGTSITADLYGKFEPKHFKVGFEQTIAERKELLAWLETDYFQNL